MSFRRRFVKKSFRLQYFINSSSNVLLICTHWLMLSCRTLAWVTQITIHSSAPLSLKINPRTDLPYSHVSWNNLKGVLFIYLFICLIFLRQAQYVFIHDALVEYVTCGSTEFAVRDLPENLRVLNTIDPDSGDSLLVVEFKVLNFFKPVDFVEFWEGLPTDLGMQWGVNNS